MFRTIVVATDGSKPADKAVALAGDLAAKSDAEITVLHVRLRRNAEAADLRRLVDVQKFPNDVREEFERFESMQEKKEASTGGIVSASIPFPSEVLVAVGDTIIDKSVSIAQEHGATKIDCVIMEGDPADAILTYAKGQNADLIVLGTRGLSNLKGLFVGSVSHKVSQLAECSCIMVR